MLTTWMMKLAATMLYPKSILLSLRLFIECKPDLSIPILFKAPSPDKDNPKEKLQALQ
jgi:hypothetical protein